MIGKGKSIKNRVNIRVVNKEWVGGKVSLGVLDTTTQQLLFFIIIH